MQVAKGHRPSAGARSRGAGIFNNHSTTDFSNSNMLSSRFCLILYLLAATSGEGGGGEGEEEEGDGEEENFMLGDKDFEEIDIEIINGNKRDSNCMVRE